MSAALTLTGRDLMRTLNGISPTVDRVARGQAEAAARLVREETGMATRVVRRGSGDYVVSVEGQDLFAREFGSVDAPGEAAITQAIMGIKR